MGSTIESVQPDYSEDGVDLTLIRWMQSLTPRERLEFLQDQVDSLTALREKFEASISGGAPKELAVMPVLPQALKERKMRRPPPKT